MTGVEWSRAAWRAHVPGADESFVAELGEATLPELAHRSALEYPDRIAVSIDGRSITHGELDADAGRIAGWLADRIAPGDRVLFAVPSADDVLVHALPLFHQHGLGGVHATLIAGSTARLLSRFSADALVDLARGASVLFAVPTMYERLVDAEVLGTLRLCVCGSAPLSETLAERYARGAGYTTMLYESVKLWYQLDGLSAATTALLRAGSEVSTSDYEAARTHAAEVRAEPDR